MKTTDLKLLCADSATLAREAFEHVGSLTLRSESELPGSDLDQFDAIITRSKTKLRPQELAGGSLGFAGTCTAGIDHADPEGLAAAGIHFASAPGCNANAVSEYVVSCLAEWALREQKSLAGLKIGIVGVGQVGSRVAAKAEALGMIPLLNDPPRAEREDPFVSMPLDELLPQVDVLTLHIPLIETAPHPTRNLIHAQHLAALPKGSLLINACRGEVLEAAATKQARLSEQLSMLILDVWDPEPALPLDLLEVADFASPHVAGHSVEGKVNGTRQIREALIAWAGLDLPAWDPKALLPLPEETEIQLPEGRFEERLLFAARYGIDLRIDDAALRANPEQFNQQRRNYRPRREFDAFRILNPREEEGAVWQALGFEL